MGDPGFYDHGPTKVELRETHISWVFIAGHLAYKLKKPLKLPFLDYSSLGRRHKMCREEVRLNRRLAPDYYLGVRSIVEVRAEGEGEIASYALAGEDHPGAVEYAVEMRAIPQERTLERVIIEGALRGEEICAVGGRLAAFHDDADPPEDAAATVPSLIAALKENHETLRAQAGDAIPPPRLDAAERFTEAFLDGGGEAVLRRRAAAGRARDGHGDLRAEHVLLTDPIQVYDCVEFDPGLREIDVAADLAFLVMDLERLGASDAGDRLENAYRAAGGDPGDRRLLAFLASYRAWVRAKVALLGPDQAAGHRRAAELHALGHRLAWRARLPFVLFVCGLAASGKTTLARALSEVSGLAVVDADTTRKSLAGLQPTERAAAEHYSLEFNRRTYHRLGAAAAAELESAGGVIVEATGRSRADRDAFREGLRAGGVDLPPLFARCEAPDEVLIARARAREADPERVSDADVTVVGCQLGSFEPLDEVAPNQQAAINTEIGADSQLTEVEALLDAATLSGSRGT